jgi:hypothetical protein
VELGKDRYGYSLEFSINDPLHADVVSADLRLAVCRRFQGLGMDPPNGQLQPAQVCRLQQFAGCKSLPSAA